MERSNLQINFHGPTDSLTHRLMLMHGMELVGRKRGPGNVRVSHAEAVLPLQLGGELVADGPELLLEVLRLHDRQRRRALDHLRDRRRRAVDDARRLASRRAEQRQLNGGDDRDEEEEAAGAHGGYLLS